MTGSIEGIEIYPVRLGPVPSVEEADQLLARVAGNGDPDANHRGLSQSETWASNK